MTGDELLVEEHAAFHIWKLNRPARRNALSVALLTCLDEAASHAEACACGAVIVTSADPSGAFCSGFDLGDLAPIAASLAEGDAPVTPIHATFERLERASFALVTAINGAAVGAGCELALLGDIRIASPRASFLLPPAKLGLLYPDTGLRRLRDALGASLLRAMLESALSVNAERLAHAGVLWSVTDDPLAEAITMAARLATLSPRARAMHRAEMRRLR